ncbi:MAG TPA: sulfurtransferase TusA family protein [Candidatus Korarchaeota archaeon]|nr:sulfurtransferase TusA family protein [Candidatus Korarchaeota archaeon]
MSSDRYSPKVKLDVRGYVCPYPVLMTIKALEGLKPGEVLEVIFDNPPTCENLPPAVKREGHEVISLEDIEPGVWKAMVRKRRL